MSRQPRVQTVRNWTERHAHRHLKLAEDAEGRIWVCANDLRQWLSALPRDADLQRRYPGMARAVEGASGLYVEASTFNWFTRKSTVASILKLRAWLESVVVGPARRRHQWQDYREESSAALPSRLISAQDPARMPSPRNQVVQTGFTQGRRAADPRIWRITHGEWGLRTTLAIGFSVSMVAVLASLWLDQLAWNIANSYLFWTWMSLVIATWAVIWNGAWMVGALRTAIRRTREGLNVWFTSIGLITNLILAILVSLITVENSTTLMRTWWAVYMDRTGAVRVDVIRTTVHGEPTRLRLSGPVGIGSLEALEGALQQNPQIMEIELDSPGGLAFEGFALADRLARVPGLITIVTNECASACTAMFLSGERRLMSSDGVLGFHRSYSVLGHYGDGWNGTDHAMADWMRERGVTESFIQQALSTPGWDLWVPGEKVLLSAGVLHEIANDP